MKQVVDGLHRRNLPKVPSASTVTRMLHDRFGLSHRAFDSARLRFFQTKFNDKRLWTCRLLAQTLSEDYLVVSVDESSFSTCQTSRSKWQPKLQSQLLLEERHRELRRRAREPLAASPVSTGLDALEKSPCGPRRSSPSQFQGSYESPAARTLVTSQTATP